MDEFIREAQRLLGAKVMASPCRDDIYTLSDGSQVQLINPKVVKYEKKGGTLSYTITTARRLIK